MNVPVKKGSMLRHHGHLYFVEDISERHSGKQRPVFHVALRDAQDGRHIDRTLDELEPLEPVAAGYRTLQYLYARGTTRVFMDSESFDEIELGSSTLQGVEPFLKEGDEFRALFAGDVPVRIDVPDTVVLKVSDTAAPTHAVGSGGGGGGSVLKEARLENGLEVHVPLFIKTGDAVKINTRTREYVGKG
jgi:elongation factor P